MEGIEIGFYIISVALCFVMFFGIVLSRPGLSELAMRKGEVESEQQGTSAIKKYLSIEESDAAEMFSALVNRWNGFNIILISEKIQRLLFDIIAVSRDSALISGIMIFSTVVVMFAKLGSTDSIFLVGLSYAFYILWVLSVVGSLELLRRYCQIRNKLQARGIKILFPEL